MSIVPLRPEGRAYDLDPLVTGRQGAEQVLGRRIEFRDAEGECGKKTDGTEHLVVRRALISQRESVAIA